MWGSDFCILATAFFVVVVIVVKSRYMIGLCRLHDDFG
jgi:hypothetical protein